MMILFAPIAYPIAKLLDYVLGSESGNTYKKAELKSFLQFHREGEEPLRDDEVSSRLRLVIESLRKDWNSEWCFVAQRQEGQRDHDAY
jgi:hypothetical protein